MWLLQTKPRFGYANRLVVHESNIHGDVNGFSSPEKMRSGNLERVEENDLPPVLLAPVPKVG